MQTLDYIMLAGAILFVGLVVYMVWPLVRWVL